MTLVTGTDLFINWKPESPNSLIVVSDYSHDEPVNTMGQSIPLTERPRLQILVRDNPMEVVQCEARCRTAYNFVCALMDTSLNGKRYTAIPIQTPTMIGRDEQSRVMYVVNFQVTVS